MEIWSRETGEWETVAASGGAAAVERRGRAMAGDWIKKRKDLRTDPAVIGMAKLLDMEDYAVVGRLCDLWDWADTHVVPRQEASRSSVTAVTDVSQKNVTDVTDDHVTGHAPWVDAGWIDRFTSCPGFAAALVEVGWLMVSDNGGVDFPKFERHMSQSAKQRVLDAERQQRSRAAKKGGKKTGKKRIGCVTKKRDASSLLSSSPSSSSSSSNSAAKKQQQPVESHRNSPRPPAADDTPSAREEGVREEAREAELRRKAFEGVRRAKGGAA